MAGDGTTLARPQDNEEEDDSEDNDEVRDGYEEEGGDNDGRNEGDVEESGEKRDDDELEDIEGDDEEADDEKVGQDEESDSEETREGLRTEPTDIPWESIPYKYPALQFWTWTVLLPSLEVTRLPLGKIYSEKGLCGEVRLDDRRNYWGEVKHCEAVLLSKSEGCVSLGVDVPADKPIYFIILIDWKGCYAERKAVGFIYRSHIKYLVPPGRVWKEIVLV